MSDDDEIEEALGRARRASLLAHRKLLMCIQGGMAFGAILGCAGTYGALLISTGHSYFVWPLAGGIVGAIIGACIGIAVAVYDRE